jgi:hypothetical protein
MIIGAVIGAAVNVGTTLVSDAVQGKPPTLGEIAQSAVVGAVTGAITSVLGPEAGPAARIAVGALANGAGQVVGNAISGKSLGDGVAQAMITGAVTGGLVEGAGALLKGASEDAASALGGRVVSQPVRKSQLRMGNKLLASCR